MVPVARRAQAEHPRKELCTTLLRLVLKENAEALFGIRGLHHQEAPWLENPVGLGQRSKRWLSLKMFEDVNIVCASRALVIERKR